ncbi:hypothetical protein CCHR01_04843 [Colletotrichum chrysophilum]|uniref:Uncharacterized protein n=1 Tax=Colletotrichum chrysophilum TaxID=1836956 RepID=A0AAD9EI54_9PEZI|nr:hypothetical protein CCHR01_04843 [Colletotrichum chrysophilum]
MIVAKPGATYLYTRCDPRKPAPARRWGQVHVAAACSRLVARPEDFAYDVHRLPMRRTPQATQSPSQTP